MTILKLTGLVLVMMTQVAYAEPPKCGTPVVKERIVNDFRADIESIVAITSDTSDRFKRVREVQAANKALTFPSGAYEISIGEIIGDPKSESSRSCVATITLRSDKMLPGIAKFEYGVAVTEDDEIVFGQVSDKDVVANKLIEDYRIKNGIQYQIVISLQELRNEVQDAIARASVPKAMVEYGQKHPVTLDSVMPSRRGSDDVSSFRQGGPNTDMSISRTRPVPLGQAGTGR